MLKHKVEKKSGVKKNEKNKENFHKVRFDVDARSECDAGSSKNKSIRQFGNVLSNNDNQIIQYQKVDNISVTTKKVVGTKEVLRYIEYQKYTGIPLIEKSRKDKGKEKEGATDDSITKRIYEGAYVKSEAYENDAHFDVSETPIDEISHPPPIKNIKYLHKSSSKTYVCSINMLPSELTYNLEYLDEFMEIQQRKDISLCLQFGTIMNGVTHYQWITVIKFLVKVHINCQLPSYILYQNVRLLLIYLMKKEVKTHQLQILSLTAMWIVLKKHESDIPDLERLSSFIQSSTLFHKHVMCAIELDILKTLDFDMAIPDPYSMMSYYFMNEKIPKVHKFFYCCCYMIDLVTYDQQLCTHCALTMALASLQLGYMVMNECLDNVNVVPESVMKCYKSFTNSLTGAAVNTLREHLLKMLVQSVKKKSDYHLTYKKYELSRYGAVAKIIASSVDKFCNK